MASDKHRDNRATTFGDAMNTVLKAEQEAKADIKECKRRARKIVQDAQVHAAMIDRRANERITMLHLRCKQDLARRIAEMERATQRKLQDLSGEDWRKDKLKALIDDIAAGLVSDQTGSPRK